MHCRDDLEGDRRPGAGSEKHFFFSFCYVFEKRASSGVCRGNFDG